MSWQPPLRTPWAACAAFLVLLSPIPLLAGELAEIEAAQRAAGSLHARFVQTVTQTAFGRTTTASGELWLAGDRLRWSYNYPEPQTYVVRPDGIWWLQPSERQVVALTADRLFTATNPLGLLSGRLALADLFTVAERHRRGPILRLVLRPRRPDPQLDRVVLWYDTRRRLLVAVEVVDAFGNRNHVRLQAVERRARIPEERFAVTPPPGWRLWRPRVPN